MDYQQTIEYLFARLPMFSRIGAAAIKKDLDNTLDLCRRLGNPQQKFRSIHIAGTNGKGSVSHMLAAVLQSAGYKTGLYTSPHLVDFRERIKVNGKLTTEHFVVEFVERMRPSIEEIEPSFFEITVAMAFEYFAMESVDIAVIETGLGGRLDSTNIIVPEICVITNIGYDHMNLLGNSLQEIATEKAGIMKKDVPAVIGESNAETDSIFEARAKLLQVPVIFADKQRYVADWNWNKHDLLASVVTHAKDEHEQFRLDLPGKYQLKNLVTTLEALHQLRLRGFNVPNQAVHQGLCAVKLITGLHGRWEIIHEHPLLVLDVAHNEAGMKEVAGQLELCDYQHLHIVIGMVKDKEVEKVLSLLPKHAQYYFTRAAIPRALDEEKLAALGHAAGLNGKAFPTVMSALQQAVYAAHNNDMLLVCGSVFTVAEVEKSKLKFQ